MTTKKQEGYELAKGAIQYVIEVAVVAYILILGAVIVRNYFRISTDDTDKNGWERSGLQLHTDYATGIQYLSDGKGGLIQRVKP